MEGIAPRPLLILSAEDDPYSMEASEVMDLAQPNDHVTHFRGRGGHDLTPDRASHILNFIDLQR